MLDRDRRCFDVELVFGGNPTRRQADIVLQETPRRDPTAFLQGSKLMSKGRQIILIFVTLRPLFPCQQVD